MELDDKHAVPSLCTIQFLVNGTVWSVNSMARGVDLDS